MIPEDEPSEKMYKEEKKTNLILEEGDNDV